ncbi:MAG TPA: PIG-L family deacetylase [Terriglobales bacterium]|nr:PIG-L family deacetylase [Terriglobales bacterium]
MPRPTLLTLLAVALSAAAMARQAPQAPPPRPDARFKADILLIVAHPDDETEVTGYLARAIFDEHKRVAVAYGTWGNSGGNLVGEEQAAALAAVRQMEARRAWASWGVLDVWSLGGTDTPTQDVLDSLETWNHGAALEKAVRLIRLTRPEVVMTWLPDNVAGENHGDHQAASVIATEAFNLAGDPAAFPEQVAPPRNRLRYSNLTEGLRPWQPQKLYYFTDAFFNEFFDGKGPQYSVTDISPAKHEPYYRLIAEEEAFHATQQGNGDVAERALRTGDFHEFKAPVKLLLARSLTQAPATADVFAGISAAPPAYQPPPGYTIERDPTRNEAIQLGQQWHFYRQFWAAEGLAVMQDLMPPQWDTGSGQRVEIPLRLQNPSARAVVISVRSRLPEGWNESTPPGSYRLRPHGAREIWVAVRAPTVAHGRWDRLVWQASEEGRSAGEAALRMYVLGPHAQ